MPLGAWKVVKWWSYNKEEKIKNEKTGKTSKELVNYEKIFRGDNNPRQNKIEVEDIQRVTKGQQMLAINPFKNIVKYNVGVLGDKHFVLKEKFVKALQMK